MDSHLALALVHLGSFQSLTWYQRNSHRCERAEHKNVNPVAGSETSAARVTPLCYADEDWLLSARIVMPSGLKNVQHGLSWP
mmetsp:Transcript_117271/g.364528  ORF Transcript_117271/g.364528 Transcript_117271/m.364528 type:complete len:82 (-) Transcript_117271:24-269(-)